MGRYSTKLSTILHIILKLMHGKLVTTFTVVLTELFTDFIKLLFDKLIVFDPIP